MVWRSSSTQKQTIEAAVVALRYLDATESIALPGMHDSSESQRTTSIVVKPSGLDSRTCKNSNTNLSLANPELEHYFSNEYRVTIPQAMCLD